MVNGNVCVSMRIRKRKESETGSFILVTLLHSIFFYMK